MDGVLTTAGVAALIGRDRPQTVKLIRRYGVPRCWRAYTGGHPTNVYLKADADRLAELVGPKGKPRGRRNRHTQGG